MVLLSDDGSVRWKNCSIDTSIYVPMVPYMRSIEVVSRTPARCRVTVAFFHNIIMAGVVSICEYNSHMGVIRTYTFESDDITSPRIHS